MKLEYRVETEDDIADLAGCVLMADKVSKMAEITAEDPNADNYYEILNTFKLIRVLLEPVSRFLCYEAVDLVKAAEHEKPAKARRPPNFFLEQRRRP